MFSPKTFNDARKKDFFLKKSIWNIYFLVTSYSNYYGIKVAYVR